MVVPGPPVHLVRIPWRRNTRVSMADSDPRRDRPSDVCRCASFRLGFSRESKRNPLGFEPGTFRVRTRNAKGRGFLGPRRVRIQGSFFSPMRRWFARVRDALGKGNVTCSFQAQRRNRIDKKVPRSVGTHRRNCVARVVDPWAPTVAPRPRQPFGQAKNDESFSMEGCRAALPPNLFLGNNGLSETPKPSDAGHGRRCVEQVGWSTSACVSLLTDGTTGSISSCPSQAKPSHTSCVVRRESPPSRLLPRRPIRLQAKKSFFETLTSLVWFSPCAPAGNRTRIASLGN